MNRVPGFRSTPVAVAAAFVLSISVALAASAPPAPGPEAPPERVVRVGSVGGDASYLRGDADDWTALGVNTPLMTGDSIYAADGGRAEVSLGRGNFARIGEATQLTMVNLTSEVTQIGVDSGSLSLRVRTLPEGATFEVDTPFAAAWITAPGLYRFSVDESRSTYEPVEGSLSVVLNGEQLDAAPGESISLEGFDPTTYEYRGAQRPGKLDEWASSRDRRFEGSSGARNVNDEVEGREDLDEHGNWAVHPDYGRVWIPAGVGPEWAPYQEGRWMWQDPYGWTWVSYEPWGWAPYHYGRWVTYGGTWAWVPPPPRGFVAARGVIMPQPVYAPALVAFIGGSNWSIGVSVGGGSSVGWVPLAPAEPYYYPWQPAPRKVVRYTNVTVVNAVTVVHVNNFVDGGGRRIKVSRTDISRAPVGGCSPTWITPTRRSLTPYPERQVPPRAVPARRAAHRALVARLVPPPQPEKWGEKEAEIRKTGRPIHRHVDVASDSGKPYRRGAKAPAGVNFVSAIAPEHPARPIVARNQDKPGRAPRRIDDDVDSARPRGQAQPAARSNRGRPAAPGARGADRPAPPSPPAHAGFTEPRPQAGSENTAENAAPGRTAPAPPSQAAREEGADRGRGPQPSDSRRSSASNAEGSRGRPKGRWPSNPARPPVRDRGVTVGPRSVSPAAPRNESPTAGQGNATRQPAANAPTSATDRQASQGQSKSQPPKPQKSSKGGKREKEKKSDEKDEKGN